MNSPTDRTQVIEDFERLVMSPSPVRSQARAQKGVDPRAQAKNPITQKGLDSQKKRKGLTAKRPRGAAPHNPLPISVREQALHEMLVKHPFLLHTPELYAGGLYLDALLNKYKLPCGLITDFTYITVQDRVLKVTLVEIEKAEKGVFHNSFGRRSTFRSEAAAAIKQVRSWREQMKHEAMRNALLINLKPLFDVYPVSIFDPAGHPSKLAKIEISYVLIVGADKPRHKDHQTLIDDLYLNENILFMTYPMIIKQIRAEPHEKNVLKLGPHGVQALTVARPESLGSLSRALNLPSLPDNDPYGVRMAGLGWELRASEKTHCATHPASIKKIFYRSGGICEKPGCNRQVITNGQVRGNLTCIYNAVDNDSHIPALSNAQNVALACSEHMHSFNDDERYFLGKPHPLNDALRQRGPYRPHLDAQALMFIRNWRATMRQSLAAILEIDEEEEPGLVSALHEWLLALRSLPWHAQQLLAKIVSNHFMATIRPQRPFVEGHGYNWILQCLYNARVIRVNQGVIEPAVFNHEFVERIECLFGDRTMMAIMDLCKGDLRGLSNNLRRARE